MVLGNKDLRKVAGDLLVKLGGHAVGKCMIPGLYDPEIPEELKLEKQEMDNKCLRNQQ